MCDIEAAGFIEDADGVSSSFLVDTMGLMFEPAVGDISFVPVFEDSLFVLPGSGMDIVGKEVVSANGGTEDCDEAGMFVVGIEDVSANRIIGDGARTVIWVVGMGNFSATGIIGGCGEVNLCVVGMKDVSAIRSEGDSTGFTVDLFAIIEKVGVFVE